MDSISEPSSVLRSKVLAWAGAALLAVIAVAYPVWRGFVAPTPEADFRFYWLAGYMWAHGLDPYSPMFRELGKSILPDGNAVRFWFYPPNWWLFCRALALFDLPTAIAVWRATLTVVVLGSTGAVAALLARSAPLHERALLVAAACAAATSIEATGNVLTAGQVSPILIYLGVALIICAQLRSSSLLLVAGLALVSLKPQLGVVFLGAFALAPKLRSAALYAVIVSLALALPQLVSFGPVTTFREMVSNLQGWSQLNGPLPLTGPGHIAARLGYVVAPSLQYALAILTAAGAGLLLRRDPRSLSALALLICGVAAFVPLHNYDTTFLVLGAALLFKIEKSGLSRVAVAAALLMALRPSRLERALGIVQYPDAGGVMLYSIAAFVLLALAIHAAWTTAVQLRASDGDAALDRGDAWEQEHLRGRPAA